MRIALVRGPSLNPYEMQNEIPLLGKFSLTAFATTYAPEWDNRLALPVERCFWPDTYLSSFPALRRLFNGACSRILGFSFQMRGLEDRLSGFSLVHTLETHTTYSFQAARAADRHGLPLIVTVWETIPGRGESHPLRAARKRFVRARADAFIAVTARAARMLEAEGVPADHVLLVRRSDVPAAAAGRRHVEVVGPEVDHHLVELALRPDLAAEGGLAVLEHGVPAVALGRPLDLGRAHGGHRELREHLLGGAVVDAVGIGRASCRERVLCVV